MFNQSRRTFIKGVAYSSVLAIGGLSSLALARSNKLVSESSIQDHTADTEVVTLINHTSSNVTFNSISSAGSTNIYQYLALKENRLGNYSGQSNVTLAPGSQLSFVVAALSSRDKVNANNKNLFITDVLEGHLAIRSDYPEFNGIVPITVFDPQAT